MKRLLFMLGVALASACSPPAENLSIEFAVTFEGNSIDCNSEDAGVRLTDLRFYVHDVSLISADGALHPMRFTPDGVWQTGQVSLIDLESGEGACLNGTPERHSAISGHYSGENIAGIQFNIGVPERLNHADPLSAEAPLSYSVMHWHWASGYKFIRAGIEHGDDSVFLHLGSNRCEGTIGNIQGCRAPNRPFVALTGFNPATDRIVFDLGVLFQETLLDDGVRSECMSGPANPACAGPFRQLGIDFESGATIEPSAAFSVSPKP